MIDITLHLVGFIKETEKLWKPTKPARRKYYINPGLQVGFMTKFSSNSAPKRSLVFCVFALIYVSQPIFFFHMHVCGQNCLIKRADKDMG